MEQIPPFKIIEEIRANNSTLYKREILRKYKDNQLWQNVLTYALDPRVTYGIKKIPPYKTKSDNFSLESSFDLLEKLNNRTITGNKAIESLKEYLENMNEEDAHVLELIIKKDLKMGANVKLINKEMAPFKIFTSPYMGAISYNEKKLPKVFDGEFVYSQIKYDGRYLNIIYSPETGIFGLSRAGLKVPLPENIYDKMYDFIMSNNLKNLKDGIVLMGEMVIPGMDRYTANGIIASFISIAQKEYNGNDVSKEIRKFNRTYPEISFEDAKRVITAVVWDAIPYSAFQEGYFPVKYRDRFENLKYQMEQTDNPFEIVKTRCVKNKKEALQHFQEALKAGEEGTIIKSPNGYWKDGKPDYQMKMKLEMTVDLKIIGFNQGTEGTRLENTLGSLICASEDLKLKTNPAGISDDMRDKFWKNQNSYSGKIVEIKCSGISQDAEGNYSLLHPRFEKVRDDKEKADTLEEIIKNEEMIKSLS